MDQLGGEPVRIAEDSSALVANTEMHFSGLELVIAALFVTISLSVGSVCWTILLFSSFLRKVIRKVFCRYFPA